MLGIVSKKQRDIYKKNMKKGKSYDFPSIVWVVRELLVNALHTVLDDDALVRLVYNLTCYVVDWSVSGVS